jgi:hypothetical protein
MTLSTTAVATARRNLAQRIGRVIKGMEAEGRDPTPWEAHYMVIALQLLEAERYPDGEWTMLHAERQDIVDTPVHPTPLPVDANVATTAELRARLTGLYGQG